eukprot:scaffold18827_cov117-Isochrysis_galbana.AAC.3
MVPAGWHNNDVPRALNSLDPATPGALEARGHLCCVGRPGAGPCVGHEAAGGVGEQRRRRRREENPALPAGHIRAPRGRE